MRRIRPPRETPQRTWELNPQDCFFYAPNCNKVRLSFAERKIVELLMQSPGKVVSRDSMIIALDRDNSDYDSHCLEVAIHRLRRKVLAATGLPLPLSTVRGLGYVIVVA
jgi:DNA-binding response OmpR family regulator